ncbi:MULTISPECIES: cytochrome P450 [unclassified Saccharopolyspora]|uniref:cytochrome P450 n=1 Tax=unclassified Saccharopolyspora TaxID=2646250 RepID=UPI001CD2C07C|nr:MULTISPECIES: cytochrome P450 [unclassified Saccharopolyspora]MCA1184970.1 cytochrome P450 [Saccharopolyspora sp. 6T]MCA1190692.1 cytochrome P450 [Saccharopolyspora sp. 6V]MCA1278156.1 cytochrome P450 [Saccharopolyspora sp. 7B]
MTVETYPFNAAEGLDLAPAYRRAQRTPGPVRVQLPFGEPAWLVTRHDEARFVFADPRFSRAMAQERDSPRTTPHNPVGIVTMDPPEHTRVRTLVAKAFTARRAERLRPWIRELLHERIDAMAAPADLVAELALPVPIAVICELLGVPARDRDRFQGWSEAVLSTNGLPPEQIVERTGALRTYVAELIAARRDRPADDLMSGLVEARDEQDRLSDLELEQLCIALLVGGYETTASQLANFAHLLLQRPGGLVELAAGPDRDRRAAAWVEELLRYVPMAAAAAMPRYAREDVAVGGQVVRAGEPVLVAIGAADRDPGRYPDPDVLDPDRDSRGHLAFGHGVHHCVGAALARIELQESVLALAERLPRLRPAGEVRWKTGLFFRGPQTLPVTW